MVSLQALGLGSEGHGAGDGRNDNTRADAGDLLGGEKNGNFAVAVRRWCLRRWTLESDKPVFLSYLYSPL